MLSYKKTVKVEREDVCVIIKHTKKVIHIFFQTKCLPSRNDLEIYVLSVSHPAVSVSLWCVPRGL